MAHYAFIDENGIVVDVIVGREPSDGGVDWEAFYAARRGLRCKRTSYNTKGNLHRTGGVPFRGNFAGKGYRYDESLDVFIPPQPHASWSFDPVSCSWVPPTPRPSSGRFRWDESTLAWVPVSLTYR